MLLQQWGTMHQASVLTNHTTVYLRTYCLHCPAIHIIGICSQTAQLQMCSYMYIAQRKVVHVLHAFKHLPRLHHLALHYWGMTRPSAVCEPGWVVKCLQVFTQVSVVSGVSAIYSHAGGYIMRDNCYCPQQQEPSKGASTL